MKQKSSQSTIPFSMDSVRIVDDQLRSYTVKFNVKSVEESKSKSFQRFKLWQNYPNPFNPETWIPYRIGKDAFVTLKIYDITGQLIQVFDLGYKRVGAYLDQSEACYWDGTNFNGEEVSSGIYFYRIEAGDKSSILQDFVDTRKMILLK